MNKRQQDDDFITVCHMDVSWNQFCFLIVLA